MPNKGDFKAYGWTTHYYGGSSIFSFSLADKAACLKANKPYESAGKLTYQGGDER